MQQFTISISEDRVSMFLELMKSLNFVKKVERVDDYQIPEEHKEKVRKRMEKSNNNPDILLDWDKVKDDFILD